MLAHVQRNGLLGALLDTFAAAGTGLVDLMDLLERAGNGLKLTGALADGAADAQIAVDLRDLAVVEIDPQRTEGTGICEHHAARALAHVDHGQVVDHRDGAKLAGDFAQLAAYAADFAVYADEIALLVSTAQKAHRHSLGLEAQHMLGAGAHAGAEERDILAGGD